MFGIALGPESLDFFNSTNAGSKTIKINAITESVKINNEPKCVYSKIGISLRI